MTKSETDSLRIADVRSIRSEGSLALPAREDFEYRDMRVIDTVPDTGEWLPYAVDHESECLVHTLSPDRAALFDAPFLYQAQARTARKALFCPIARAEEWLPAARPAPGQLTFVFSIGRCGSTLLSRLFDALAVPTFSEPDIFTQLTADRKIFHDRYPGFPLRHAVHYLGGRLLDFARAEGSEPATVMVKLRSQVSGIARAFVRGLPEARFVFVVRNADDWFRSAARAFGRTPEDSAGILLGGLTAIDRLAAEAKDFTLLWYEDLVADPVSELERLVGPIDTAAGERVRRVMQEDSQRGSSLNRKTLGDRTVEGGGIAAFRDAVARIIPQRLIAQHELERLFEGPPAGGGARS